MNPVGTRTETKVSPKMESFLGETHHAAGIVYFKGQNGTKDLPDGWSREALPDNGKLGLAKEFEKCNAEYLRSPSGQKIVAFRGTVPSDRTDWKANAAQAFGIKNQRYDAAAKIGEAFKNIEGVVFTGHSLGGGLAKLAGEIASDKGQAPKTVVGFNAAPVTPATYRMYDCAEKNHTRTTIHVVNENDVLNRMLKGGKLSAVGAKGLFDRERPDNSMIVVAKGEGNIKGSSGHGIKNFVTRGNEGDIAHFTAPLRGGAGALEPADMDRFAPKTPEKGRSGIILGAARGQAHENTRAVGIGR